MSARAREGRPGVPEAAVEAFSGAGMDCTESDAAVLVLVRLVPVEPVRDDVSILDADPSQMVCFR